MAASASASPAGTMLGCNVVAYDSARPTPDFTFAFAPVVINQGAAGAPDSIAILKGSSTLVAAPKVINVGSSIASRVKADTGGRTGIGKGDRVIAAFKNTSGVHDCAMFEITNDTNADQLTYDHAAGGAYTYPDPSNPSQTVSATARHNKGSGFTLGGEGLLYSLGAQPMRNIWSVANGRLQVANDLFWTDANGDGQNDAREAADSIIDLQAQYGVDTTGVPDGIIDDWTKIAPADWTRVLAIRFALLTRSQQFERDEVTTAEPRWTASGTGADPDRDSPFVMTNIDGTPDTEEPNSPNNWRYYRYNVFEAVVPLRNTIIGRQL
jgi:type IV pilus assembly protein PilW